MDNILRISTQIMKIEEKLNNFSIYWKVEITKRRYKEYYKYYKIQDLRKNINILKIETEIIKELVFNQNLKSQINNRKDLYGLEKKT